MFVSLTLYSEIFNSPSLRPPSPNVVIHEVSEHVEEVLTLGTDLGGPWLSLQHIQPDWLLDPEMH